MAEVTSEQIKEVKEYIINSFRQFLKDIDEYTPDLIIRSTHAKDVSIYDTNTEELKHIDIEFSVLVYHAAETGLTLLQSSNVGLTNEDITSGNYKEVVNQMFPDEKEIEQIKANKEAEIARMEEAVHSTLDDEPENHQEPME